jgi:hypothetical protein
MITQTLLEIKNLIKNSDISAENLQWHTALLQKLNSKIAIAPRMIQAIINDYRSYQYQPKPPRTYYLDLIEEIRQLPCDHLYDGIKQSLSITANHINHALITIEDAKIQFHTDNELIPRSQVSFHLQCPRAPAPKHRIHY